MENVRRGIDLTEFGFNSRAHFLRTSNVPQETFYKMVFSDWEAQKAALLHRECPLDVRQIMTKHPIWYKRLVAYFATKGPENFWQLSKADPDKRIKNIYNRIITSMGQTA